MSSPPLHRVTSQPNELTPRRSDSVKKQKGRSTRTIGSVSRTYNLHMTDPSERAVVEDPIPGPETIGPSLDGPDWGVYQHEVGSSQSISFPNEDPRADQ